MVGLVVVVHLVCIIAVNKGNLSLIDSETHFVREQRGDRMVYSSRVESETKFKRV